MLKRLNKILISQICLALLFQQTGFAQVALVQLPMPGRSASSRNPITQNNFRPVHLRSVSYDSRQDDFKLLLDKGDVRHSAGREIEATAQGLFNYFLVGISLPNDAFWVNLRPDSPDSVMDPLLAQTEVGKIFLEADLQLKKDTAKATSPETPEGRAYWDKLYKKAEELYGDADVAIPTVTRPWIVPDEIIVSESAESAFVYKASLKVMLEQDYIKDSSEYGFADDRAKQLNEYSSQLIREKILPGLVKQVNSAKRYAPLRQVYYSLILAQWFKARNLNRDNRYSSRINGKDITGLRSKTPFSVTAYFNAYKENFTKGEYNIQTPHYGTRGQNMRRYFSGGIGLMQDPGYTTALAQPFGSPNNNILPSEANNPVNSKNLLAIGARQGLDGGLTINDSAGAKKARERRLTLLGLLRAAEKLQDMKFPDERGKMVLGAWTKEGAENGLEWMLERTTLVPADIERLRAAMMITQNSYGFWNIVVSPDFTRQVAESDTIVLDRFYYEAAERLGDIISKIKKGFKYGDSKGQADLLKKAFSELAADSSGKYKIFKNKLFRDNPEQAKLLQYLKFVDDYAPGRIYKLGVKSIGEAATENEAAAIENTVREINAFESRIKGDSQINELYLSLIDTFKFQSVRIETAKEIAKTIIEQLRSAGVERRFWPLFREPLMSLRYEEFTDFYNTQAAREYVRGLEGLTEKEQRENLRQKFIESLGTATVFRAVHFDKNKPPVDLSSGMMSPYRERFTDDATAQEAIDGLARKFGIVSIILSSVFRRDLLGGELTVRDKGYIDNICLSVSELDGYALAVGRAYAYANKLRGDMGVYEITMPRFFLINEESDLFQTAAEKEQALMKKYSYFKNIQTNETEKIDRDDPRLESLVISKIRPEWIKKVTLYPITDEKGVCLSVYWGEGEEGSLRAIQPVTTKPGVIVWQSRADSSPTGGTADGGDIPATSAAKPGGIDFRALPIVIKSMESLKARLMAMFQDNLENINLGREWSAIERLVNSGIAPSAERLKEYFAASCFKGNLSLDKERIVTCISEIIRMEESKCYPTDPMLKDILVVLGSGVDKL